MRSVVTNDKSHPRAANFRQTLSFTEEFVTLSDKAERRRVILAGTGAQIGAAPIGGLFRDEF